MHQIVKDVKMDMISNLHIHLTLKYYSHIWEEVNSHFEYLRYSNEDHISFILSIN